MTTTARTSTRPALMTPDQTSNALGISLTELNTLRHGNAGPKFHRIGWGLLRDNTADVMRWRASRAVATAASPMSLTVARRHSARCRVGRSVGVNKDNISVRCSLRPTHQIRAGELASCGALVWTEVAIHTHHIFERRSGDHG